VAAVVATRRPQAAGRVPAGTSIPPAEPARRPGREGMEIMAEREAPPLWRYPADPSPSPRRPATIAELTEKIKWTRRWLLEDEPGGKLGLAFAPRLIADLWDAARLIEATPPPPPMPAPLPGKVPHIQEALAAADVLLRWCYEAEAKGKPAKAKRTRRGTRDRKPRPLTPRQTEVVQIVGECRGDIAKAAKRLGLHRKTVAEAYRAGLKKLGKVAVTHGTRLYSRDRRGQADISDADDMRRQ